MTTFLGENGADVYRYHAIAKALRLYARHKIRVNRLFTPTNMMRVARDATGIKFRAQAYEEAADALEAKARQLVAENPGCVRE